MDILGLLQAITTHEFGHSAEESRAFLDAGINALTRLCDGGPSVEESLAEIVVRALETRILADEKLLNLARYWQALVGKADEIIAERLGELFGVPPPQALIDYVKKCVRAGGVLSATKANISLPLFERLAERTAKDPTNNNQLRCETCGYHFRSEDMGRDRLELVRDAGLELATSLMPGRNSDTFKPIEIVGFKQPISLLKLEVDHVTPEAGLGWTDVDNLRFGCTFCNNGKGVYRRPREGLGSSVASSLMLLADASRHTRLKQQTVASTLAASDKCAVCLVSRRSAELTVRPKQTPVAEREWFVPWALRVVCYPCAS